VDGVHVVQAAVVQDGARAGPVDLQIHHQPGHGVPAQHADDAQAC
jgi:hypothetical protein